MMRNIALLLICLFLANCSPDDPTTDNPTDDPEIVIKPNPLEGLPDEGPIRFDNPTIGQRSYYAYFKATYDNTTKNVNFEYTTDTLVLAITRQDADHWIVKEFLTDGSASNLPSGGVWSGWADSVFVRHLRVDSDSIYFTRPASANLFSFLFVGEKRKFPLQLVTDSTPLNPGCLPTFGYSSEEWMQYTLDYTQFGQTFNHLNDYFDYREMAGDGLGFMYVYSPSSGIVRWTWVSAWEIFDAEGWDLVPK